MKRNEMSNPNYRAHAAELFADSLKCIEGVLLKSGAAILEQMHTELSYRDDEIERLRCVLGKVIAWLPAELGHAAQKELLGELHKPEAVVAKTEGALGLQAALTELLARADESLDFRPEFREAISKAYTALAQSESEGPHEPHAA